MDAGCQAFLLSTDQNPYTYFNLYTFYYVVIKVLCDSCWFYIQDETPWWTWKVRRFNKVIHLYIFYTLRTHNTTQKWTKNSFGWKRSSRSFPVISGSRFVKRRPRGIGNPCRRRAKSLRGRRDKCFIPGISRTRIPGIPEFFIPALLGNLSWISGKRIYKVNFDFILAFLLGIFGIFNGIFLICIEILNDLHAVRSLVPHCSVN